MASSNLNDKKPELADDKEKKVTIGNYISLILACVIEAGKDADLLVMDKDLKPIHLFMKGRQVMKDSEVIVKGAFEE